MNYRNAKNLADGRIDCEIKHPTYGWIPFTADPNDIGAQFDVASLHIKMSQDPFTKPYIPPTEAEIKNSLTIEVRTERDRRLREEVDIVVTNPLRWNGMTVEQQGAWAKHRQALLDITVQKDFPFSVVWPIAPK